MSEKWRCENCRTGFETTQGAIEHALAAKDHDANIWPIYGELVRNA